jgi:Dihydrofolate reductase
MNLIVAVDKNWGIGKENKLLVSIPSDMKFFREETTGNVVVMGRKTLESFPNGQPLRDRVNIILSGNKNYRVDGAIVVNNEAQLLAKLKEYDQERIYVIGGGSIYEMLLPHCKVAHVTKIDFAYEADTYFPDLDKLSDWRISATSDEQTYFDLEYYFVKYERA